MIIQSDFMKNLCFLSVLILLTSVSSLKGETLQLIQKVYIPVNNNGQESRFCNSNSVPDSAIRMDTLVDKNAFRPDVILDTMKSVADWQFTDIKRFPLWDWVNGAFYTGVVELTSLDQSGRFMSRLQEIGKQCNWKCGPRPFMADDYCIGQLYSQLYKITRDTLMIRNWKKQADEILSLPVNQLLLNEKSDGNHEWSWCDALFMAPSALAYLTDATGEMKYLNGMDHLWWKTANYLYNKEDHLFYRDSRFFKKREANGKNVYWSRGNGWVMGGLVRILTVMPKNYPDRSRYVQLYREMAERIASLQPDDGYWRASLLDPDSYPAKETSGTGFFCYALAWGINNGYLSREKYCPIVYKAWLALMHSIHPNGMIGYVQRIGDSPDAVKFEHNAAYGAGAFLLAGSEMIKLAQSEKALNITLKNTLNIDRASETVELPWFDVDKRIPSAKEGNVVVNNVLAHKEVTSQIIRNGRGEPVKLIFQTDMKAGTKGLYEVVSGTSGIYPSNAYGRFVPERKDDFAWENNRIAFRVYGPALQATGEISSGVDVWAKRTSNLVIDKWYKQNDYHVDHGEGMDCYRIGPTLGAGSAAPVVNGKLYPSKNYTRYKILANGPIRIEFLLEYAPWNVDGYQVSVTKKISLDTGSFLNRNELTWTFKGNSLSVATGIVKRGTGGRILFSELDGLVSYWEPETKDGVICLGIINPESKLQMGFIDGHVGTIQMLINGHKSMVYYSGAGWNRNGAFQTPEAWESYLKNFAQWTKSPLLVEIK